MATQAHCAYCFESLSASLERRQPLTLRQVQESWTQFTERNNVNLTDTVDAHDYETKDLETPGRPAAISRLLNRTPASSSSSSSLSTNKSSASSTPGSSSSTTSSLTSLSNSTAPEESHPLFVTWNTISKSGYKSLRGCIGTFQPMALSDGLRSYALTSALQDHRFSPIPLSQLPSLECCVTLLTNFSEPDRDPMNWTLGRHGLRISFTHQGRRYGATYLPDVALEQGWTKEETIVSLMRKAGWNGRKNDWTRVSSLEIIRYEGKKVDLEYNEWRHWRQWVESQELGQKSLT